MEKEIHQSDIANLKIVREAQEFYELMMDENPLSDLATRIIEKENNQIFIEGLRTTIAQAIFEKDNTV